jgi:hypothetical protein
MEKKHKQGEASVSRADKMSGWMSEIREYLKGKSKRTWKKIASKKRRQFLKNKNNWNKM